MSLAMSFDEFCFCRSFSPRRRPVANFCSLPSVFPFPCVLGFLVLRRVNNWCSARFVQGSFRSVCVGASDEARCLCILERATV